MPHASMQQADQWQGPGYHLSFGQPAPPCADRRARSVSPARRAARAEKATRVAPRPVAGLLRPVVSGQVRRRQLPAAPRQHPDRSRHSCRLPGARPGTARYPPAAPLGACVTALRRTTRTCTACTAGPVPQTVKYNTKKRAGRGFTLEELKVGCRPPWSLCTATCTALSFLFVFR